jgi:hypothetical protein
MKPFPELSQLEYFHLLLMLQILKSLTPILKFTGFQAKDASPAVFVVDQFHFPLNCRKASGL